VVVDIHDFHKVAGQLTEKQRQSSLDDYHHELAGLSNSVGRQQRFLNKDKSHSQSEQRRRANERIQQLTALQTLLNDPIYRALFEETMSLLEKAESATEQVLERAEEELRQAEEALQKTLDDANCLPDGKKVFRDTNGDVRTADGKLVDPADAASIVFKDDAPSYEDYTKAKQHTDSARDRVGSIRRYQTHVLGGARDRMTDPDNPPSKDDMDDIQKDITEKAPPLVQSKLDPEIAGTPEKESTFTIEKPSL
jgi:multidrug efflux pump subunit AcrA (membrane-fusion protein)